MENRERRIYKVTLLGSIVNLLLLVAKFVAGILGHSAAMIADAVHSLSDFLTDIIVIVFVKISNRPADEGHDYGHGKFETLATSIIGIALITVAGMIGVNGASKIYEFFLGKPHESPEMIAFVAAIVSIVAKEWIFRVTKKVARDVNSQALEANAWHHRSDALSSIGTAVGIGGAVLLGNGWAILDSIAAVVVSIMILITAFRLLREASGELLEESLPKETEDKIREIIYRDPMATDVHQLHTRRIGSAIAIEMHFRMPADITLLVAHDHADKIEHDLKEEFGPRTHVMLHYEP